MMKPSAPAWILCLFYLFLAPLWALDAVDATFAPVIRGPGTVQELVWHPGSSMLYAAVSGNKLNGQLILWRTGARIRRFKSI